MPASAGILGFSNRWYPTVLADRRRHELPGGPSLWLVSAPCFLATKLEAFHDRGQGDLRASHDLEDLLAVVDGRPSIEAEVAAAGEPLRAYLATELAALLDQRDFIDALSGHLPGDPVSQARVPRLRARLERLAGR